MKRRLFIRLLILMLPCVSVQCYARNENSLFEVVQDREPDSNEGFFFEKKKKKRTKEESLYARKESSSSDFFSFEKDDDSKLYAPPPESGDGQKLTDDESGPENPLPLNDDWIILSTFMIASAVCMKRKRRYC